MKVIWVAASAGLAWLAIGFGVIQLRRWRRPDPEAVERARRLHVHSIGRLVRGEIIDILPADLNPPPLAPVLVYQYQVGGVTYQVSQALHLITDPAPGQPPWDPNSWIPGWPVQVKFDPANPGNSIVACEHWRGLSTALK